MEPRDIANDLGITNNCARVNLSKAFTELSEKTGDSREKVKSLRDSRLVSTSMPNSLGSLSASASGCSSSISGGLVLAESSSSAAGSGGNLVRTDLDGTGSSSIRAVLTVQLLMLDSLVK